MSSPQNTEPNIEREFRVEWTDEILDFETQEWIPVDNWTVSLPHQCDNWVIAGEENGDGVPHAEAVRQFEAFIAAAQQALSQLKARQEVGWLARG